MLTDLSIQIIGILLKVDYYITFTESIKLIICAKISGGNKCITARFQIPSFFVSLSPQSKNCKSKIVNFIYVRR